MTLLEALPRADNGAIALPIAAIQGVIEMPGTTTAEFVMEAFGAFADKAVPLGCGDYESLLVASSPVWRLNWQRLREAGVI